MPTPFDNYTLEDARAVVVERAPESAAVNKDFYEGDHWQDGDGWIGPKPAESDENAESVWNEIAEGFVSKNAVKEVVGRHADAVVGQEPDWNLTVRRPLKQDEEPNTSEQALIEEANAVLVEWWDKRKVFSEIQEAVRVALRGERACVRLYVPQGLTEAVEGEQGTVRIPTGTLAESFERLFLEVVEPNRGAIEPDPDTQMKIGAYLFTDKDNLGTKPDEAQNFAELHYLDDMKRAVIRRVGEGEGQDVGIALDLNGHIAFYELRLDPFITEQIRSNNKLLNMALTMLARNVVLGGFLERILLNAQLPGSWIDNPDKPGTKMFAPAEFRVGAGSTNALAGLPIYGDSARPGVVTGYASPSVVYRDPVPVDSFLETKAEAYRNILEEVKQLHALIAGDATASGESRKQASKDFVKSLRKTVAAVNDLGRWLIETSLAMAANFSGQPARFAELRGTFACNVDADVVTDSDIDQAIKLKDADLLSSESAMMRVGVDDPAAEMAKIQVERDAQPEPEDKGAGA